MGTRLLFSHLLLLVCVLSGPVAYAQTDEKKFEVGWQFTILASPSRTANDAILSEHRVKEVGYGPRFGYNFTKHLALESEFSFFTLDREVRGGSKIQGLFGVKAGQKFKRFGLFGKARPGFVRFQRGDYILARGCVQVFPPPLSCYDSVATTNFAFDLGAVVEIYTSGPMVFRFDVGDTMIHFRRRNVAARDPSLPLGARLVTFPRPAETRHNLQASVGFGFRF